MADVSQGRVAPVDDSARGTAIIAYVLYLVGWPSCHLGTIVGLILAYIKRGEVRGTIWESHFDNLIETFWMTLVLGIVFGILCIFLVGIPLIIGLAVWFLYRTIKGLIRAIDNKAYF